MIPPSSIGVRKRISVIVPLHEVANSAATPRSVTSEIPHTDQYSIQSAPSASFPFPSSYAHYTRHLPARKNKRLRPITRSLSPPQVNISPHKLPAVLPHLDSTFCTVPLASSHHQEQTQTCQQVEIGEGPQLNESTQTVAYPPIRTTVSPSPSFPEHSNTIAVTRDTPKALAPEHFYPQPQPRSHSRFQEQFQAQFYDNSQPQFQLQSQTRIPTQLQCQFPFDPYVGAEVNPTNLAQTKDHVTVEAQSLSSNQSLAQSCASRQLLPVRQFSPEVQPQVHQVQARNQCQTQLQSQSGICKELQTLLIPQNQPMIPTQSIEKRSPQPQIRPDLIHFYLSQSDQKPKTKPVNSLYDCIPPLVAPISSETANSALEISAKQRSDAPLFNLFNRTLPSSTIAGQGLTTEHDTLSKCDASTGHESNAVSQDCDSHSTDVVSNLVSSLDASTDCGTIQRYEDEKGTRNRESAADASTAVKDHSLMDAKIYVEKCEAVKDCMAPNALHPVKRGSTSSEIDIAVERGTFGKQADPTDSAKAVKPSSLTGVVEGQAYSLSGAAHRASYPLDGSSAVERTIVKYNKPLTKSCSSTVPKESLALETKMVKHVSRTSGALEPECAPLGAGVDRDGKMLESLPSLAVPITINKRRPRSPGITSSQDALRKKRRVEKGNCIESMDSSTSLILEEYTTEALLRITAATRQRNVVWTKVKGHPFWPTQIVDLTPALEAEPRFLQALRFRKKGENTCVMYFGTCEIAFVNRSRACITWNEGIRRNFHTTNQGRHNFQRALSEVKNFCSRAQRFPRGWWNEPDVLVLHADFIEKSDESDLHPEVRPICVRADKERVCWAKVRGFPHWPVQVLPHNMAVDCYPELKLGPDSNRGSSFPCMFFGTAEVAVVPDKNIVPFLAGISRGYPTDSDRRDFVIALGEVWGYLQEPRIWPSGHLSGKSWWNYVEQSGKNGRSDNDSLSSVSHVPHYDHIKKSVWGDGVEPIPKPKKADIACCECLPENDQDCCIDSSCLNFASNFLCSASCRAGRFCKNVNFHKRKSPRMTPFFTADQRGWGLKVEELVRRGDFVVEYVGEIINRDVLEKRLKIIDKEKSTEYYMMDLTNDLLVDAKFKGNLSRFINSSCEPNCQTQKWTDPVTGQTHVCIFAIQDILPGTELTYNYCFLDFGLSAKRGKRSFSCHCGTASCCMLKPIEQELMRKLIGKRIEVRWDDGWYPGFVETYNIKKKRFRVQYDDGDCEDLALGLSVADQTDNIPFRLLDEKDNDPRGRDANDPKNRIVSDSMVKANFNPKIRNENDDNQRGNSDLKSKHPTHSKVKNMVGLRGKDKSESKRKSRTSAKTRKG